MFALRCRSSVPRLAMRVLAAIRDRIAEQSLDSEAMRRLALGLTFLALSPPAHADAVGTPRVIDGDTIAIGHQRVRFFGIDARITRRTSGRDDEARVE